MATYSTDYSNYDPNFDYMSAMNEAAKRGDYATAANYEQYRNQKVIDMHNSGDYRYDTTNMYTQYLPGNNLPSNTSNQYADAAAGYAEQIADIETPEYVAPDTSALEAELADIIDQLENTNYNVQNFNDYYTERSLEDYVAEALASLEPQYQDKFIDAQNIVAQNLNRSGIYNSLYGQALNQNAQNELMKAMLSDANVMAAERRQQDFANAFAQYESMINQQQYDTSAKVSRLTAAGEAVARQISTMMEMAGMENDFNLQSTLAQLNQYTAAVDAMYQAGALNQQEYQNRLAETEMALNQAKTQLTQNQAAYEAALTAQAMSPEQVVMTGPTGPEDEPPEDPDLKGIELINNIANQVRHPITGEIDTNALYRAVYNYMGTDVTNEDWNKWKEQNSVYWGGK